MNKEIKKWKIEYDSKLDEFFCGRLPQPKDARMYAIETGFYYYLNKKGEITGICIEYFKTVAKEWLKLNKRIRTIERKDRTIVTKCPNCGSRKFVIGLFASICGDCFYEEKIDPKE